MSLLAEIPTLVYTGRVLPVLNYVGLSLLAFFVLAHNIHGKSNRIFALMALSAAFWNVAIFLVLGAGSAAAGLDAWRIYNVAVLVLVPSWTYFAINFAASDISPSILYVPSAIFLPFVIFTDTVVAGVSRLDGSFVMDPGPLFSIYNIYILGYILYGILTLARVYAISTPTDKRRIRWILGGIGIVVLTATFDITLRLIGINTLPLSPAASLFAILGIGYSFVISVRGLR